MRIMKKPASAGQIRKKPTEKEKVTILKRLLSDFADHVEDLANQPLMKKPSSLALEGENKNEAGNDTHEHTGKLPSEMISLLEQARPGERYVLKSIAEAMWGGADNIRQAIENGEVEKFTADDEGKTVFYKWLELPTDKNVGCRRELQVGQHGEPDATDFKVIVDKLNSMSWGIYVVKSMTQIVDKLKKNLDVKGELSETVNERVEESKKNAVKAVKEAEKILKCVSGSMTPAGEQAKKDMLFALKESILYLIYILVLSH